MKTGSKSNFHFHFPFFLLRNCNGIVGGGYDEEVHRDLTAALAYVAGFSEEEGNIIGKANQWLDDPT
ncbi:MAG: hypothetical protein M3449_01455, partial [Acidobacteriota bacterium]|nr:hypothetical protein [Acidobacteriota bacterium]